MSRASADAWVHLPPTELVATVQTQPTPDIPLASIRELIRPVYDDHGALTDWMLFASGFDDHEAVADFWQWRNTWRRHWPIGPITNIEALRDTIAEIEHDLDRHLDRLLDDIVLAAGRPVVVSSDATTGLLAELATVRLALSVDDRTGMGIVDDMPARSRGTGLARTWLPLSTDSERPDAHPCDPVRGQAPEQRGNGTGAGGDRTAPARDVMLTGTPTSAVVLRAGAGASGLAVLHGGPPHEAFEAVTAVDLRGESAVVLDERGMSLRLDLHEARPLAWLVPRSLRWHVRPIPLVAVWALTFDGLGEALRCAGATGEPMVITGDAGVA